MATITSVSPGYATRGTSGTLVTIKGTGFQATQTTGTVTVGGKALAVTADTGWSDTQITGTVAADTPLGVQDVVVTPSTGAAATAEKAVYAYDAAEQSDVTEVDSGMIDKVFVDGVHVGDCVGSVSIRIEDSVLDHKPNHSASPTKTVVTGRVGTASFTMRQINGTNVALAFGGTYDSNTKVLSVRGTRTVDEKGIMVMDKGGRAYIIHRAQLLAPAGVELNAEAFIDMPMSFRCLPIDDDTGEIYRMILP